MKDIGSINLPSLNTSTSRSAEELVYSGGCPGVESVSELASLSEFSNTSAPSESNLVSRVKIGNMQSACSYNERSVTIDLSMDFLGTLGPHGNSSSSFSYPFFVAVTSASGDILAKEIFAAPLTYGPGETTKTYTEKMRQIIPIENRDRGSKYKILVGLQLTPNQLAYNRQKAAEDNLLRQSQAAKPTKFQQQAQDAQKQAIKEIYIGRPVDITP